MNILAKVTYGSRLYATNLPTSDLDIRGVYLPTIEECLLLKVNNAFEEKKDNDIAFFSLQKFLSLAAQGQSIAIEMLAVPSKDILSSSHLWEKIRSKRKLFYTKNMHSFLGYSKGISQKYSMRIDRLNETKKILDIVGNYYKDQKNQTWEYWNKLSDIWDILPESTNANKGINNRNNHVDNRCYTVCGREFQSTITIDYFMKNLYDVYSSYGERVKNAKDGKIDWKALMHAFRVALQCKEIVETGDLKFPLKDCEWLKKLRMGEINFFENSLDKKLDDLIYEVQEKMNKSDLPDKVENNIVESFILEAYGY